MGAGLDVRQSSQVTWNERVGLLDGDPTPRGIASSHWVDDFGHMAKGLKDSNIHL